MEGNSDLKNSFRSNQTTTKMKKESDQPTTLPFSFKRGPSHVARSTVSGKSMITPRQNSQLSTQSHNLPENISQRTSINRPSQLLTYKVTQPDPQQRLRPAASQLARPIFGLRTNPPIKQEDRDRTMFSSPSFDAHIPAFQEPPKLSQVSDIQQPFDSPTSNAPRPPNGNSFASNSYHLGVEIFDESTS